jgi:hypothetical protein
MDADRARTLLGERRQRVERLIAETRHDVGSDRAEASETGDIADPAERLTAEEVDTLLSKGCGLDSTPSPEPNRRREPTVSQCEAGSPYPTNDSKPTLPLSSVSKKLLGNPEPGPRRTFVATPPRG